jgi:signal transduction histidine kinase/CheY-like chemotaxis protein
MERRLRLLADASSMLASSLEIHATLLQLARMIVPALADWCTITVRESDGVLRRVAGVHADPARLEAMAGYLDHFDPARHRSSPMVDAIREGRSFFQPHVTPELLAQTAQDPAHLRALETLGCTSVIIVPLVARGGSIGALSLAMSDGRRSFDELDHQLARELGGLIGLAIDNARRESEHQQLLAQAEAGSRAKDEFFAILGHELRNPLAPITTAIELMKMRGGAPERELAIIDRQTRHLARLVDDLLDASRIARGVELAREPVDIAEIVRNAAEMVGGLLVEREHELAIDVERGLVVNADPTRLAQIISNLLTNAARYTPEHGTIAVHAARVGDRIVVRVRDNGAGIPAEIMPHVFDAFVQQRQPLDRSRGGLGLGLAIVRSLVEAHGGTVTAHSEGVGRGSELVVELPAAEPGPPRATAQPVAPPPVPRPTSARVLVVDDNEDAAELLAETLERAGYQVETALDGPQALAACRDHVPSAALLDIGLPGMDGFELARRLRALPGFEHVFLVAVTGYGQDADRERTRAAGFDEHLVKPVTMRQIRAVLAAGLRA